jgi:hypothetical protein
LKYIGTPGAGWRVLGSDPSTVQIDADGGNLYQLRRTGDIFYFTGSSRR